MCGIAGAFRATPGAMDLAVLRDMLAAIRHRGPDDEGVWHEDGAWLGQRRLAIVDLSSAGRQPMVSSDGRYVITLNGEIYNHAALRRRIDSTGEIAWRGRSDTEVLLEAIARFGLDGALALAQGMFAFVVWDRRERAAHLVRDRMGEKPLCYFASPDGLTFASDMTALRRAPEAPTGLSGEALSLYFRFGYVPAPHGVNVGVHKLPPGCVLTWRAGQQTSVRAFWSLADVIDAGRDEARCEAPGTLDALDRLLREVVGEQMLADVPLGAFLSGGIDSSLVTAIMQSLSDRPVRTFTLGFDSPDFNEADEARAVARHLGADHTEHVVTQTDAQAIVPRLGAMFDEPFADASQIPTFLVSQMAREHVTVCLTGDGGDEVFGGYVRYPGAPRLWNAVRRWPFRRVAASALRRAPLGAAEAALGFLGPLARQYTSRGRLGPNLRRAADWVEAASFDELYELTMTAWADPDSLLVDPPRSIGSWRPPPPRFGSRVEAMMWRDSIDYLPGDILCKVDRATMANSLESRAPLLDSRVVEFAWRTPESMKLRDGATKWMLRQVLYRYVPRDLVERPKKGFSVPQHAWLTGALRGWAEDLLDPRALRRQGILKPDVVARLWRRYQDGDSSLNHKVWTILMFQSWAEANGV
jgi:asparagine synthase (glutamine-hydrolysing)